MYRRVGKTVFCLLFITVVVAWWSMVIGSFSAIVPDRIVLDDQTKYLDGAQMESVKFFIPTGRRM